MASVFYTLAKAMFKNGASNIEIPNFAHPHIKYIFELPFEFRIAVAFGGLWIGVIAFDQITDILERKYLWFIAVTFIGGIVWALKQYLGIGPTSEDLISLFDEDREGLETLTRQWKPVVSSETLKTSVGKPIVLQWVSKQYGNLYLTDEKKPHFTFAKKIEHASKFQLIGIPSGDEGIDTVAFFSETRRAYLTNNLVGYLKVEALKVGSWERYHLDFVTDRGQQTDLFQLRSISRGRHMMHIRDGNVHKGFHDKYGEVAYFRMFYFDSTVELTPPSSVVNSVSTTTDSVFTSTPSNQRDISVSSIPELRDKVGTTSGWKVVTREDKISYSNPLIFHLEGEGFLLADPDGKICFADKPDEATHFQVCGIPNDSCMAFFSRTHQKYLTLGGLFASKLTVTGTRFDSWEKFKLYFDRDEPYRCKLKVLKTRPPPSVLRCHLGFEKDKTKAVFTLLYHESKSI